MLWGGREGYETLLNTDLGREADQLARFLHLVVEHKHRIGFTGTILIEPKPFEPTKHQYDYDTATVYAFLQRYDLASEVKVNIEVNHATLAGHDFHHEVAYAHAAGIFGSIDANAGDDRLGWDVDRFPVSVEQMTLGMYEILRGGGFTTGGLNFDAKLRRQSIDRTDLFHAHIAGMDTMARALLAATLLRDEGELEANREARYAGWSGELGREHHERLPRPAGPAQAGVGRARPGTGHRPAGGPGEPRGPRRRTGPLTAAADHPRPLPTCDRERHRRRAPSKDHDPRQLCDRERHRRRAPSKDHRWRGNGIRSTSRRRGARPRRRNPREPRRCHPTGRCRPTGRPRRCRLSRPRQPQQPWRPR